MPTSLSAWLERIQDNHPDKIELGLERVSHVWRRMGSPRPARKVITVAGTNGKGSTVAGIEAAFLHLQRPVGSYTSPHLLRFEERIRIDATNSSPESIIAGFERVEAARGDTRLTYFEFITLAAFETMRRADLDIAVLEVGLGGRLDAVNVVDADCGVITTIGIDHQEYLGEDRESIGYEKSGIMRSGQTTICSDREPPESVLKVAGSVGVKLIRLGADFDVSRAPSGSAAAWHYFFADEQVEFPVPAETPHLADNLAGALTAVITSESILQARLSELASVVSVARVRGRLEQVSSSPDVFVDVGHNPLAARAVAEFLCRQNRKGCRLVLGMLKDKDAEAVATMFGNHVGRWYCAGLDGPRGQTGIELEKRVRRVLPDAEISEHQDVRDAMFMALEESGDADTLLVFGSFLTAAEAIRFLENRE